MLKIVGKECTIEFVPDRMPTVTNGYPSMVGPRLYKDFSGEELSYIFGRKYHNMFLGFYPYSPLKVEDVEDWCRTAFGEPKDHPARWYGPNSKIFSAIDPPAHHIFIRDDEDLEWFLLAWQ